jgi:hypothetical protein
MSFGAKHSECQVLDFGLSFSEPQQNLKALSPGSPLYSAWGRGQMGLVVNYN